MDDLYTYEGWVQQRFNGSRVRVTTESHVYEGWARTWNHDQPSLMLYDAERDDGERFNVVVVNRFTSVEQLGAVEPIEVVSVDDIEPSPYSARTHDEVTSHVREARFRGHMLTYPTVHRRSEKYEVLGGHRRVNTAKRAGLDSLPVRVLDLTEWGAACRFVFEHFPLPSEHDDRGSELYTDDEIARSLDLLRDRWSDDRLRELPHLRPFLE